MADALPVARRTAAHRGIPDVWSLHPPGHPDDPPIGGLVKVTASRWVASIDGIRRAAASKRDAIAAAWVDAQQARADNTAGHGP